MSDPVPALLDEIQFGVFTADLRAGELRKQGRRIKLQERPFQILAILLEHPGEVVTRDQLRSRLWPDGTFVDFDHSISSAVRKLRDALCDSAGAPRYIETVETGYLITKNQELLKRISRTNEGFTWSLNSTSGLKGTWSAKLESIPDFSAEEVVIRLVYDAPERLQQSA